MILIEAIRDLDSLDEDGTIYAVAPWTEDSEVLVAREPESGDLPSEAQDLGLEYFLEVSIAQEFLNGWMSNLQAQPTLPQQCARLIEYATTDA